MYKLAALSACLFVLAAVNAENHFIDDCLNPGKTITLLYDQQVSKSGSFLHVQEETIRIPSSGFSPKPITCITVTNLDSDADGGYPTIQSGGISYQYVNLHLKSQKGKGYNFRISVYYDDAKAITI